MPTTLTSSRPCKRRNIPPACPCTRPATTIVTGFPVRCCVGEESWAPATIADPRRVVVAERRVTIGASIVSRGSAGGYGGGRGPVQCGRTGPPYEPLTTRFVAWNVRRGSYRIASAGSADILIGDGHTDSPAREDWCASFHARARRPSSS